MIFVHQIVQKLCLLIDVHSLLLSAYYLLLAFVYLLLATCYWLFSTCQLLLATCYLLLAAFYFLLVLFYCIFFFKLDFFKKFIIQTPIFMISNCFYDDKRNLHEGQTLPTASQQNGEPLKVLRAHSTPLPPGLFRVNKETYAPSICMDKNVLSGTKIFGRYLN